MDHDMHASKCEIEQKSGIYDSDSERAGKRNEKPKRRPRGVRKCIYMDPNEMKACRELGFELEEEDDNDNEEQVGGELHIIHQENENNHNFSLPLERIVTNRRSLSRQYSKTSSSTGDNSPIQNWRISSPGDDPQEVKARLKVWAQAVALESTSQLQH